MKKVEIETKNTNVMYEAADGKRFVDEANCIEYERTFACMVKANIKEKALSEMDESDIFGNGSPEATSYTVIPKTEQDIRDIQMLESYIRSKYESDFEFQTKLKMIGQVVIVTVSNYDEWINIWSLHELTESLTKGSYKISKNNSNKGE